MRWILAALAWWAIAGCATRPTVTIATDAVFPPFHMIAADGSVTGYDIELARAAVSRAGRRPVVVVVDEYADLFTGLAAGRHDMVAATTGITPTRRVKYLFSEPYFTTTLAVVVRDGGGIETPAGLAGRPVGASRGTTSVNAAEALDAVVVPFDSGDDAATALSSGVVDALIADELEAIAVARSDEGFSVLAEAAAVERYGFVMAIDRVELKRALDDALAALESDGTAGRLRRRFGLGAD